jgi:hypothetical protein
MSGAYLIDDSRRILGRAASAARFRGVDRPARHRSHLGEKIGSPTESTVFHRTLAILYSSVVPRRRPSGLKIRKQPSVDEPLRPNLLLREENSDQHPWMRQYAKIGEAALRDSPPEKSIAKSSAA